VHDNKLSSCSRGRPECLLNLGVDLVEQSALALLRGERRGDDRREVQRSNDAPRGHEREHTTG
jgi:hypothetical protein